MARRGSSRLSKGAFGCGWYVIIILLAIGYLIGSRIQCGGRAEAMSTLGAPVDWSMNQGLSNNWVQSAQTYSNEVGDGIGTILEKHDSYTGTPVPLQNGQMFLFADNKASAACCNSATYSSSDGCVCTTAEQLKYINQRGGNRTAPSYY